MGSWYFLVAYFGLMVVRGCSWLFMVAYCGLMVIPGSILWAHGNTIVGLW